MMEITNTYQLAKKPFFDRKQAGQQLAKFLKKYTNQNPLILALPRGGVPVGFEIARALQAPLDVIISRKIGLPSNREFGIGALGEEGVVLLDEGLLSETGLTAKDLQPIIVGEDKELRRRIKLYRENQPLPNLKGKTVILIDDGLATGVTAKAAIAALRKLKVRKIVFSSPVCAYDTARELTALADEVICFGIPFNFGSVGSWYQNFEQISDRKVLDLLNRSKTLAQKGGQERSISRPQRRVANA